MASGKRQGQSESTHEKGRGLGSGMAIGMKVGRNSIARGNHAYWHLDTNSGSGHNEEVGVDGSPVVFHKMADKHLAGIRREAFFCDKDRGAMLELRRRLKDWPSYLLPGNNEEALKVFAERIRAAENPRYATGSVIVDPNNYYYVNARGDGPPIEGLPLFMREFLRIDVILNLNVHAYWRQIGAGQILMPPREVLQSLNKKHWLVKHTRAAGNQFLLVSGRNTPTGDHQKVGFYKIDSAEGRDIMAWAEGRRGDDPGADPLQQLL